MAFIKKGKTYRCVETTRMSGTGEICFTFDRYYKAVRDGVLIDDQHKEHTCSDDWAKWKFREI